jgi:hypothetical protein
MHRLPALACLALAIAGPACAQDIAGLSVTGSCASVPILPAAIPVVEVTIGGKGPYKFAIDTGAQGHGRISTALAEELGLPKVGEVGTPAPGGTVATRRSTARPRSRSVGSASRISTSSRCRPCAGPTAGGTGSSATSCSSCCR